MSTKSERNHQILQNAYILRGDEEREARLKQVVRKRTK